MDIPWAMPYIAEAEIEAVTECIESTWVTMGDRVERFEAEVADYVGVDHAIAVTSGTAALDTALKALGIQPDDEIIVPAMTYIATVNSVLYQHADPVLADIDPYTYNLDPERVRDQITDRTRAILPIDYGGQCADYETLRQIAEAHDIHLIGDAAESLSASHNGEMAGSLADVSITSFHAAKLMTSVEGGMVFTDDDELAKRARIIRNQGEDPDQKYRHPIVGHNYRMSDLNASVGLQQFERLEAFTDKREDIAQFYTDYLESVSDRVTLPYVDSRNDHAWFLYSILLENRDKVQTYLGDNGIGTRITWPIPVHEQPAFGDRFAGESYPISERFAEGVLSLPMYHTMSEEEMDYVVSNIESAVEEFVEAPYELE